MTLHPEYSVALIMGFLGSFHCLGMCGPIALVVPSLGKGKAGRVAGGLIYNGGRIVTYAILGFAVGLVGRGLAIFQWQQGLSISVGLAIVLYNVLPSLFRRFSFRSPLRINQWVKENLSSLLKKRSAGALLVIGLLNGLLPCGLVYMGLAGSLEAASATNGALFMILFGFGTLPMMSGIYLMGFNLNSKGRRYITRVIPYFAVLIGLLFILRGLGLGIPYLSPSMDPHEGDIHCTSPAHRHAGADL